MCSQQGVRGRSNKRIRPIFWSTEAGLLRQWLQMAGSLVRLERKQKQIGNRYYTASILGLLEGFVWLQQSLHVSLGKISEAHEVVLKHRHAHLSLHPCIHPSLLLDPLLPLIHIWNYKSLSYGWLIAHVMTKFKCESIRTAQKAIEICCLKKSAWNFVAVNWKWVQHSCGHKSYIHCITCIFESTDW